MFHTEKQQWRLLQFHFSSVLFPKKAPLQIQLASKIKPNCLEGSMKKFDLIALLKLSIH